MKRYIAIGVAALLLAGVVYWSCSINSVKKTKTDDPGMTLAPNISANGADSVLYDEGTDYFESFRAERESTRALEIEYLDEVIAASANDSETLKDATEQKLQLVANMETEFSIEKLIIAKGFSDAAVTFHKGAVNVVIEADELTSEQVAQILENVKRESGEKAENIKIMAGGM